MRNKTNILLIAASAIVVGIVLAITNWSISRNEVSTEQQEIVTDFTPEQYNWVLVDTFQYLVTKAYAPNVATQISNNQLIVNINNANQLTKDFFNGNDALLKYDLEDFGFAIKYSKDNNNIQSIFAIKNGAVPVPNDVMIKLVDKIYN